MQHNETIGISYAHFPSYSRLQNQPFRASPNYDHCSITKAEKTELYEECREERTRMANIEQEVHYY